MRSLYPALPPLLALACASSTPTPQKMRLEYTFPSQMTLLEPATRDTESRWSRELDTTLEAFVSRARAFRAQMGGGNPMPDSQVNNWREILSLLDLYLTNAVNETPSPEVERARRVLEAELELDTQAYAEMPPELIEGVLKQVDRLSTLVAKTRRQSVQRPAASAATFCWPVEPVEVTSFFGRRRNPITKVYQRHQGLDLAARPGQPVKAAGDGVVLYARFKLGHGNHVEIAHGNGLVSRYSHLSTLLVEAGSKVERGDLLGRAGSTGRATGVHLHFELRRNGEAVDPLDELGGTPPRTHTQSVAKSEHSR